MTTVGGEVGVVSVCEIVVSRISGKVENDRPDAKIILRGARKPKMTAELTRMIPKVYCAFEASSKRCIWHGYYVLVV